MSDAKAKDRIAELLDRVAVHEQFVEDVRLAVWEPKTTLPRVRKLTIVHNWAQTWRTGTIQTPRGLGHHQPIMRRSVMGRLLIIASIAALLNTVPAAAQDSQQPASSTGKVTTELTPDKTKVIREKIIATKVKPIEHDKIGKISVGIIVPTSIELHPLPIDVIEFVPDYRGYLYFMLTDGTIVIVEPSTLQIAHILAA